MNCLKKSVFQIPLRIRVMLAVFLAAVLFICPAVSFVFYRGILDDLQGQAEFSLSRVGSQNASLAEERILDVNRLLDSIAGSLEEETALPSEQIFPLLENYTEHYGFYSMGLIDSRGICRTTRGEVLDVSSRDYFQKCIGGERVVTEGKISENQIEEISIFAVPVQPENGTGQVLTAAYCTDDFIELMNIRSFDGNGGTVIVDQDGRFVSSEETLLPYAIRNLPGYFNQHPELLGSGEAFAYSRGGEEILACTQKLSVNGWKLVSYVNGSYLKQSASELGVHILLLVIGLYFVIALISAMFIVLYRIMQKKILEAVFLDPLTGRYNYQFFLLEFPKMSRADREGLWLVNFDIEKFRLMNLIYGKQQCDCVLKMIDRVFEEMYPGDRLYRCHEDVFAAVMAGNDKDEIRTKIRRFRSKLEKEAEKEELPLFTPAFGVCPLYSFTELSVIYSNACTARQSAKKDPGKKERFYDDVARELISQRNMETDFKKALEQKEFEVWYQPKVDIRCGRICGAEALVRWRKGDGSYISPARFVPLLEETGQITELDEEVIRSVCSDSREAQEAGIRMCPVSVNLSKRNIEKDNVTESIRSITASAGMEAGALSFEITESAADTYGKVQMERFVENLHEMGFTVDMDDYGTGSSTLKSLSETRFDRLKLDRSFISRIGQPKMDIILKSTIRLAEKLQMEIVAEGVETEEQARFLREQRCYIAQGFYFYQPMRKSELFSHLGRQEQDTGCGDPEKREGI